MIDRKEWGAGMWFLGFLEMLLGIFSIKYSIHLALTNFFLGLIIWVSGFQHLDKQKESK